MPSHPYQECPVCGWQPECAYLRDDRALDSEAVHDRVVAHVRETDDRFHNEVQATVEAL